MGNHDAAVKDSGVVASRTEYAAYGLNRHASVGDFVPQFDADGNQTLLKTETAVWLVDYNAENRPVRFTRIEGTITTVHCEYDHMGRRATKTVTVNNNVTLPSATSTGATCKLQRSTSPTQPTLPKVPAACAIKVDAAGNITDMKG